VGAARHEAAPRCRAGSFDALHRTWSVNAYMKEQSFGVTSREFWLGGTDLGTGRWTWVTGPWFSSNGASGAPINGAYVNFSLGSPQDPDWSRSPSCIRMVGDGRWTARPCSASYPAVCERD
jgi:hypothetical protein